MSVRRNERRITELGASAFFTIPQGVLRSPRIARPTDSVFTVARRSSGMILLERRSFRMMRSTFHPDVGSIALN